MVIDSSIYPGRLENAELTSLLHPPHVTPVIPATYTTSSAIAVEARARTATARVASSFFMDLVVFGRLSVSLLPSVYGLTGVVVTEISANSSRFYCKFPLIVDSK